MNLTTRQLRQIINEEIEAVIEEFASIEEDEERTKLVMMFNTSVKGLLETGYKVAQLLNDIKDFGRGYQMEKEMETLSDKQRVQYLAQRYKAKPRPDSALGATKTNETYIKTT